METSSMVSLIDSQRQLKGFMTVSEVMELCQRGNVVLDPFSTLISAAASIGTRNTFYPNVVIEVTEGGSITIGDNNIFHSQSYLLAEKGSVRIGNSNQFGDGGFTIKANMPNSLVIVENNGRYLNGVQVLGRTKLGSGSQVIGDVTVQNCELGAGETFQHQNPDLRAAVLKGSGLARDLVVPQGNVINGLGTFNQTDMQAQSFYHPKKDK